MQKMIFLLALSIISAMVFAQQKLPNGIYLVTMLASDAEKAYTGNNEAAISYHPHFVDDAPEEYYLIEISRYSFVPLELSLKPLLINTKREGKKIIMQFNGSATEKLKAFTAGNLKRYAVIVVNGMALTVHKIKEAVDSGVVQITNCMGRACEELLPILQNHVMELY
jgi:hypothetical protein